MTLQVPSTQSTEKTVYYPESDGKPMAETDLHRERMFALIHLLQRYLAAQEAYVSGNLLVYFEEGNPRKSVAPDCFVVWGVPSHFRRTYKIWEEGIAPQIVFEISSKKTQREDYGAKMRLYAALGVEEYYIYDPTADYLDPPLAAFRLVGGGYVPMEAVNGEVQLGDLAFTPDDAEPPEFVSPRLGLRITLDEENQLIFYEESTGARLLTDEEARRQAEDRADRAEAENARLREELARLRGE